VFFAGTGNADLNGIEGEAIQPELSAFSPCPP
jgi:hypothetical protein